MRVLPLVLLLTAAVSASARPVQQTPAREIDKALVRQMLGMLGTMQRDSRRDALRIKEAYRPLMKRTMFDDRQHLQRALDAGDLVPLSRQEQLGIQPRLSGRSVIGGLDLQHQHLYVTARPAAIGMLLEIARRVQSGPLEVTSMVRSRDYQRALLGRNANAATDVPTHAMGYAIDIGLLFTPMETAREIRRVLEQMRAAGRIYFIAERAQLAFHVVPVPSRFGEFERAYRTSARSRFLDRLHRERAIVAAATVAAVARCETVARPYVSQQNVADESSFVFLKARSRAAQAEQAPAGLKRRNEGRNEQRTLGLRLGFLHKSSAGYRPRPCARCTLLNMP